MNTELLIPLLTFGGTLLLVVTGLLNFSVFVRVAPPYQRRGIGTSIVRMLMSRSEGFHQ